jgi:tape measure domain-containing protein
VANTIDNRIVQLQFDNKQFETALGQTITSLDKLTKALEFKNATSGIGNITSAAKSVDLSSISAGVGDINWALLAVATVGQTVFRNLTTSAMTAGAKIAKALTIQGAITGFSEYETKMNSIKTMMAASGESMGTINKALAELNDYADKTIYNFAQMTTNVSKFINTGVGLEDSVKIVKGMSNAAALAGANQDALARTMFQLTQAMSAGYMRLEDFRPIMDSGIATKEFKTQLLEAGVAMGNLKKTGKDTYQVLTKNSLGKVMKGNIGPMKLFTDSLQYKWLDSGTLVKGMQIYGDETTAIGRKAAKAATDVDTFTKMMDTVKEAIQSDWAKTWEAVLGDKSESLKFWTDLSNAITKLTSSFAASRNTMLQFWNDNNGRAHVIGGLTHIFKILGMTLAPVGKAFKEVFAGMGVGQNDLVIWSHNFEAFAESIQRGITPDVIQTISTVFKGLFSAIALGMDALKFAVGVVKLFVGAIFSLFSSGNNISGFGQTIKDVLITVSEFFIGLRKSAQSAKPFEQALTAVGNTLTSVVTSIKEFVNELQIGSSISGVVTSIKDFVGSLNLFGGASNKASESLNKIKASGEKLSGVFDPIKESISGVVDGLKETLSGIVDGIKSVFSGVVALAPGAGKGIMAVILGGGLIQMGRIINAFIGLMRDGFKISANISIAFEELGNVLQGWQLKLKAEALKAIAIAVALLAASLLIVSLIDPARLMGSITSILTLMTGLVVVSQTMGDAKAGMISAGAAFILFGIAIGELAIALNIIAAIEPDALSRSLKTIAILMLGLAAMGRVLGDTKNTKDLISAGAGVYLFATAIGKLANTLKTIGTMDPEQLKQGLLGIGSLIISIIALAKWIKPEEMQALGANMLILSGAIFIMAMSLKILSGIPFDALTKALGAMGLGIAMMVKAVQALPKDAPASASALIILAGAMVIMGLALKLIASMSWSDLTKSLLAVFIVLEMMTQTLERLGDPKMLAGAAGLVLMAGALLILGAAMVILGGLSWEQIGKGLAVLAGSLILLLAAGAVAGIPIVATGLTALSSAVALIGIGIGVAAAGLGIFAAGMSMLINTIAVGGPAAIAALVLLSEALPQMAYNLGTAVGSFAQGMVDQQAALTTAVVSLFTVILDGATQILPKILTFIGNLISGILKLLGDKIPEIVKAVLNLLVNLLKAITEFIPKIVKQAGDLIVAFINALGDYYVKIAEAGANFIIKLMEGIGKQALKIANAAMEVVIKFIEGLTASINKNGKRFDAAANDLIKALYDRIFNLIGTTFNFGKIGTAVVDGLKAGIVAGISGLKEVALQLASGLPAWVKKALGITSPSKVFKAIGKDVVAGLIEGLTGDAKGIKTAAAKLIGYINTAVKGASDKLKPALTNVATHAKAVLKTQEKALLALAKTGDTVAKKLEQATDLLSDLKQEALDFGKSVADGIRMTLAEAATPIELAPTIGDFGGIFGTVKKETDDGIASIQSEVDKAATDVATAQGKLAEAQNGSRPADTAKVTAAQNNLTTALNAQAAANTNVARANEYLAKIQGNSNSSPAKITAAQNGLTMALNAQAKANTNVATATEYLTTAQKGTPADTAAITSAQNDLTTALEAQTEAQKKLDAAKAALPTGAGFLASLKEQLVEYRDWEANLAALSAKNMDHAVIEELRKGGASSNDKIKLLLDLTPEQIAEYSATWCALSGEAKEAIDKANEVSADTVITNLGDRLYKAQTFLTNLAKLTELGLNADYIKEISTMGVEAGSEIAAGLAASTPAQITAINGMYTQLGSTADTASKSLTDQFYASGIKALEGLVTSLTVAGKKIDLKMKAIAESMIAVTNAVLGTDSKKDADAAFHKIGSLAADGLIKGVTSRTGDISIAFTKVVNAGVAAAMAALDEHSPSRVFVKIGQLTMEGWKIGILSGASATTKALEQNAKDIVTVAEAGVKEAYSAMASAGGKAVDVFSNIEEPVIKPVVDLDNIYKGAKAVASIMSNNSSALKVAGMVNARVGQENKDALLPVAAAATTGTEIKFEQNNYSPKSLSRLELYRQTQNQLLQLKGLGIS